MKSARRLGQFVTCALLIVLLPPAGARAEVLHTDAIRIPIAASDSSRPVELEAIVVRPDDGEAHPLAVLNHGSPRDSDDRPTMSPYRLWPQAVAFARRGWVAVVVMRRGYGSSQGE
jgi:hypothetical protein